MIAMKSQLERRTEDWLIKNNIAYKPQKNFKECRDSKPLPFDFEAVNEVNQSILIELDGQQHFKPASFSKLFTQPIAKQLADFEKIKLHDKIKNEYCSNNNKTLIRISFRKLPILEETLIIKLQPYFKKQLIK